MTANRIISTILCASSLLLTSLNATAQSVDDEDLLNFLPGILAGVKRLPIPIDFNVKKPVLESPNEYLIDLSNWGVPSNGTNALATTNGLQAALDWADSNGYNKVIIPNGTFLIGKYGNSIYQRGLELHSNMSLELSPNTVLKMAPNDKWNYCILALTGDTNVTIRGGTLIGDRNEHTYTPRSNDGKTAHDEGHGICIQSGSTRILVEDMTIRNLTGDGLLLVNDIEDVTIRNNNIYNNRRQGVSLVGTLRVAIEANEIHHIKGTSPQFGIDIEGAGRSDKDILIRKNYFHHNRGGDIVSSTGRNTFIVDNVLEQGDGSSYIDGPLVTWHRSSHVIAHNKITMLSRSVNGLLGYIQYSSGGPKAHNEITYVHDNVCNGCGMYMYKSADADIRRNKWLGYFLALNEFDNATVIDNVTTTHTEPGSPSYCWSYRIRDTTGQAAGNTHNGVAVNLPLSNVPWTTACLR
ncbi:right-handed parallel beta-helix repeat-containing protein [Arenicella xantha]|uniref:Parallel beta helix pectate lyase-like protein n=1 Tax=Arenicella xantha TaxID=644221 RepID=A0A395JEW5_9GAMM|nr:right-handed parallel beta-helix repeat-containing protein [Arenicella xantha]RBP47082.1 parallel beta helix pectate lyase-like protein [Arenicella xantha]